MADRDKGRTLWREEVIQEANRVQSDLDRSEFAPDAEGRRHVEDRLHQARDAAEAHERRWKRVRSWWSGIDIEAAWRAIHAAKQELIDGMADPDLRAQYPLLRSKVKQYHYSIQRFTGGQTVRQWLSTQPYELQQQFGWAVLRRYEPCREARR
jgi:hypothetical protein